MWRFLFHAAITATIMHVGYYFLARNDYPEIDVPMNLAFTEALSRMISVFTKTLGFGGALVVIASVSYLLYLFFKWLTQYVESEEILKRAKEEERLIDERARLEFRQSALRAETEVKAKYNAAFQSLREREEAAEMKLVKADKLRWDAAVEAQSARRKASNASGMAERLKRKIAHFELE